MFLRLFFFTVKDWLALIPPTALVAGVGYMSYMAFCPQARKGCQTGRCNPSIRKHEAKVVDMVDIENIAEKAAFCRCWKTKNVNELIFKTNRSITKFSCNFSGPIVMAAMVNTTSKPATTLDQLWSSVISKRVVAKST